MPDALEAYNVINDVSDELTDQMTSATFYRGKEIGETGKIVSDLKTHRIIPRSDGDSLSIVENTGSKRI